MNTSSYESERVPISLETVWRALTGDANAIYTNPERIVPDGLEELTWLSVQRRMKDGF